MTFARATCAYEARGSGVRVDQRVYNVLTLRDGRIARIEDYSDRSKALQAAGLSEYVMSQANVEIVSRLPRYLTDAKPA